MNAVTKKIAIALLALGALLVPASQASAAAAPAWRFDITSVPTNFPPVAYSPETGLPEYFLLATNVGTAPTKGPVTITDTLPAGLTLKRAYAFGSGLDGTCTEAAPTVTCVFPGPVRPGEHIYAAIGFDVDGTGTILHEGDTIVDRSSPKTRRSSPQRSPPSTSCRAYRALA